MARSRQAAQRATRVDQRVRWADLELAQKQAMLDRYEAGETCDQLVEDFNLQLAPVTLRVYLGRFRSDRMIKPGRVPAELSQLGGFETYWELYCDLLGRAPYRPAPPPVYPVGIRRKVVVLCDLHGSPDETVLKRAVEEQAQIYLLAGDVFDLFGFSRFKNGLERDMVDELSEIRATIERLLYDSGAEVLLIEGNHDRRAWKYFSERVALRFLPLVQTDLLSLVTAGLPGARVVRTQAYAYSPMGNAEAVALENRYLARIGEDALICHLEMARKGEGRTVDAVTAWIDEWRTTMGWPDPRLIVQAHVHRAAVTYPRGGHQVRVEGGYAGKIGRYTQDEPGYSSPVKGYVVFEQLEKNGQWFTDLSSVRFSLC